jgi:hypothetical protein
MKLTMICTQRGFAADGNQQKFAGGVDFGRSRSTCG